MYPQHTTEALLRELNVPRRNRFFYGKRMDVQHFEMEQSYGKLKQWLLNRLTLGKGVLCGLRVSVDGERICVDPGVAIDGLGREIIVPVRSCIDPLAPDDGCCSGRPEARNPNEPRPREGLFTLWLCYHECLADQQPVLVSDCNTRDHCAAGTVVESFCLKVTKDLPPLQGDPNWCAVLWQQTSEPGTEQPSTPSAGGSHTHNTPSVSNVALPGLTPEQVTAMREAFNSRRHALCELMDEECEPTDENACVPLALIALRDGRYFVESCLVRPRVYSNAKLLDLILCLAAKIDDCCGHDEPAELMQVRSIEFVHRDPNGGESAIVGVSSPLQDTNVDITKVPNAIRIRFSQPFSQDAQHVPTTHALGDPDFKRHNVQVLPDRPLRNMPFVPGTLAIESADTIRFDLFPDSPYVRDGGFQKGRYRVLLRGEDDTTNNRPGLRDLANQALDGEPIAPVGGVISGKDGPGGDFAAPFVIGAPPEPEPDPEPEPNTLRVHMIEFLRLDPQTGALQSLRKVDTPLERTNVEGRVTSIRVEFTREFSQDPKFVPTIAGRNDNAFAAHNVQLRLSEADARQIGVDYVPCELKVESPTTIRLDVLRETRITDNSGAWRFPLTCELFLRGNAARRGQRAPISDLDTKPLDGEPIAPAHDAISGANGPGGDFVAAFHVNEG